MSAPSPQREEKRSRDPGARELGWEPSTIPWALGSQGRRLSRIRQTFQSHLTAAGSKGIEGLFSMGLGGGDEGPRLAVVGTGREGLCASAQTELTSGLC